jgi:SAM-dependent methyltransferase
MTTTLAEETKVPDNFQKGAKPTSHQLRRRRAVLNMLQGLQGRVLDFGCGYGDLAYAISKTNDVCGVDLDAQRVAFAAKEYAPLEFKQCSTDDAPYPDQSFDIVASIVVINFIPDAAGHLRSIRRLLKDNGHLILACKSDDVLRNGVRRMFGRPPVPSKLHMRSREEIRKLLAEHHFAIERESYFYDPPFSGWKNLGDAAFRTLEAFLSLAQVSSTAGYFLMLCKKQPA